MAEFDDLISSEPTKNAIFSIADEMAVTIRRIACSGILCDNIGFSTTIANSKTASVFLHTLVDEVPYRIQTQSF